MQVCFFIDFAATWSIEWRPRSCEPQVLWSKRKMLLRTPVKWNHNILQRSTPNVLFIHCFLCMNPAKRLMSLPWICHNEKGSCHKPYITRSSEVHPHLRSTDKNCHAQNRGIWFGKRNEMCWNIFMPGLCFSTFHSFSRSNSLATEVWHLANTLPSHWVLIRSFAGLGDRLSSETPIFF